MGKTEEIEKFKIYISYDPADHNESEELYQFLMKNGDRIHCDRKGHDKTGNRKFRLRDIRAIRNCNAFILLISHNALGSNKWLKDPLMYEYAEAINFFRNNIFVFLDDRELFPSDLLKRFSSVPKAKHIIFPEEGKRTVNYEELLKILKELGCSFVEEGMEQEYDVFISYKSEDHEYAQVVYDILKSRGLRAFLSGKSLPELGRDDYSKQIDLAIERARHMIVVASQESHLNAKWVEYEWRLFSDEKLAGRKQGNLVTVLAKGLSPSVLPIRLRNLEAIPLVPEEVEKLLEYVR